MNFFYAKEFEIGYVLIFSSVKISTYKYHKTNKTLTFIYHYLHAHRISPPLKEFFNNWNETTPLHYFTKKD